MLRLRFGKHKGKPIEDVPSDYLRWALENCDLDEATVLEMEAQLRARDGEGISRKRAE